MIKQPDQWHNDIRFIVQGTDNKIGIQPQITETHDSVRSVDPEERRCLFEVNTKLCFYC